MTRGRILGLLLAVAALTFVAAMREEKAPRSAGDADERIAFYKERAVGPASYPAYARLGMAYLQKARETGDAVFLVRAEQSLQESMKFQSSFEALRALAFLSMEQHQFERAARYAKEALAALPADLEAQGLLSDAYSALGEKDKALGLVQQMLAASENFAGVSRLGVIRFADGDVFGAIAAMRNACNLAEKESRPLDNRAWCYTRIAAYSSAACDFAAAEEAYRQALATIPNYYGAMQEKQRPPSACPQNPQL